MSANFAFWAVAALLLFAAEALAPGAFMLWFGLAASAMALLVLVVHMAHAWQALLFAMLSVISVGIYVRWFRSRERASAAPLLNRRADQLIGEVAMLESQIAGGRGRVQIGDAFWAVEGADVPAGTWVRVVAVDGMTLKVQEV